MTTTSFKIWDETNTQAPKAIKGDCCFTVGVKRGRMRFSLIAAETLTLTKDSHVIFLEGQGDTPTLFVAKTKGRGIPVNYEIKGSKTKRVYYSVSASLLVKRISEICHNEDKFKIRMGTVPEPLPKGDGLPAAAFRLYINESICKSYE